MRRLLFTLLLSAAICLPQGWQTPPIIYQQFFANVEAVPTTSIEVTNIGQAAHFVLLIYADNPPNVCVAPAGNPTVILDYSYNRVEWIAANADQFPNSAVATNGITGQVYQYASFVGTYPYIRFRVTAFDTVNCQLNGYYTGMVNGHALGFTTQRDTGADNIANTTHGRVVTRDRIGIILSTAPYVFDGTTWDRARGSAETGSQVGAKGTADALYAITACDSSAVISVGVNTTTQIVGLVAGDSVRVCAFELTAGVAGTYTWVQGTGANCAVGTAAMSGAHAVVANTAYYHGSGLGELFKTVVANALCITTAAGASVEGLLTYAIY